MEAAVYHTEIADNLSRATAHLCERVAVCSQLVEVIRKYTMERELAEVYKQFFLFLLEAAKWFNKSESSRFFDSFNKKVKEEHDVAVSLINDYIDLISNKGHVEGLLMIEDIRRTEDIIEWKLDMFTANVDDKFANLETAVDELRKQGQFQQYLVLSVGNYMRDLLLQEADSKDRQEIGMCCWKLSPETLRSVS